MTGQRSSYGKRPYSRDYENGGGKRRQTGDKREAYAPGPEDTIYRYLCPGNKIGSIIGRGGEIVKQLRADTHAKIKIGESVPGSEERVITIFSTSDRTNTSKETVDRVCPAQDALFRVHERLASEQALGEGADEGVARLLIPSDQIGSVIGKAGQIIQSIRSETGVEIRVLKDERLPACGINGDELLQIKGKASAVKKALVLVSSRLHDNPSRSHHLLASGMPEAFPQGGPYAFSDAGAPVLDLDPLEGPYAGYRHGAAGGWPSVYQAPRDDTLAKEFSIRLVCPVANIGGVIGKGGIIIKQIREDSGAFIKVDSSSKEDDCIIIISAKEFFEDQFSPTIDAAVRLQPRCSEKTEKESGEASYTTRVLVQNSRVGCLIGKGGTIISEMRRSSRAGIRILSKDDLPKVAAGDDEMVQISGDLEVTNDALVKVLTRLRANFFEREDALSAFPPSLALRPTPNDMSDGSRYLGREGRGYSSYSGAYSDVELSDRYGRYDDYLGGGSRYNSDSGRSGSTGLSGSNPARLSGSNPVSHGKHYGY